MQLYRLHRTAKCLSPPGAMWPSSRLGSLGFISLLCHPFPPATLSELRPVCFSSDPPPCYINDAEGKIVCQTKMKFFLNFIVEVIMDST
jgi:hypothetical protein